MLHSRRRRLKEPLLQAVDTAVEMNRNGDLGVSVSDYLDENISDKVIRIIHFYTDVVNKFVKNNSIKRLHLLLFNKLSIIGGGHSSVNVE